MTHLILAAMLHASLAASGSDSYSQAHQEMIESGKPMVVMVGTDWCPPCQRMKKLVLPEVRQRGLLAKVAFAIVNADHSRTLAKKLTGGGPIPQLILYRNSPTGWKKRKLVGGQTIHTVERFISQGISEHHAAHGPAQPGQTTETAAEPPASEEKPRGGTTEVIPVSTKK